MQKQVLPFKEKVGYALGDAASNFYWKSFEFFLLFFYTDVFGISAAAAGTLFGVTRIWDAINDPLMGAIADRTRTRWGKFRPYLLWLAVPNAAAAVLTFTTPDLAAGEKLVYAYVTYTLMMMAFTAINIPYSALMGVMTSSSQERTSLSSFRFVGAFSAGLVVLFLTKRLVVVLGNGSAERGWQLTMAVWGAIATALFCMTFVTTNERVEPPAKQETNLVAELGDLARNGPWMVMFLLGVLVMTSFWIRSATTVYYFKYFVNRDSLFEWFAISGTFASILGIGLTAPLARLVGGKKRLYMALMAIGGLLTLLFYVIPPDRLALIFGLNILIGIVLGPQAPLVWAMYADTADYSEWKTGRRATGLVFSAATFALKLGGALAGWVTGQLLTRFGYVANQAQTAESLYGILVLMSVLPGMLGIMAAVAVLLYKLDDGLMTEIEAELLARRLASEPSVHRAASGASQA